MFACAMTIDQFILSSLSHQCISSVPLAGNARSSKIISRAPWHLVVRSKYTSCTILILNAQRWRLASTFLLLRIRLQGSYISLSSIDFYSSESTRRLVCVCAYSFWSMPEYGIPKCTIQFNYFNVYAIAIHCECAIWLNKYNCVYEELHMLRVQTFKTYLEFNSIWIKCNENHLLSWDAENSIRYNFTL